LLPATLACHWVLQPHSLYLDAAKSDDPNYDRWCRRYGSQSPTELDAMHPEVLQATVRQQILDGYDDDLMRIQEEQEMKDRQILQAMRRSMLDHLATEFPEYLSEELLEDLLAR
jgi:hypothetical protein